MGRDIVGVLMGFLLLSGVSLAIVKGDKTAQLFTGFANGWATMTKSATLQG